MGTQVELGFVDGELGVVSGGRVPEAARVSGAAPLDQASVDAKAKEVASLVRAARDGDRLAFGRLYERYAGMVHGILMARVPLAEVDDLVQDVFVRALKQVRTVREAECFGGWLATVTRNRANDYHRRSVEAVELTEDTPGKAVDARPSRVSGDDGAAILALIGSLPETYRETLILRLVEGMTGPEIAERTGLTPGSVRVNLHRGLQMLREKLA